MKAAVRAATHRDLVQIEHKPAATALDLLDGLAAFRPHVVHFSGHAGRDLLEFDTGRDGQGVDHEVGAEAFKRAIAAVDRPPTLVVLNACHSQAHLEGLLEAVPLAIGMAATIDDRDAMAFATRFYSAIAEGQSVAASCRLARVQMELEGLSDPDLAVLECRASVDPELVCLVLHPDQAG